MHKELDHLMKLLRVLTDLHDILITICERKRDALVQSDMQTLDAVVQEQEKVCSKLHQVEQERLRLMEDIFATHFPDARLVRMDTLVHRSPEDRQFALEQARRKLRKRVENLQRVNDLNKTLCKQGLSTVSYYLEVLTSALTEDNKRYDMHARTTDPKRINLLDQTG